jgi:hypothetical protein
MESAITAFDTSRGANCGSADMIGKASACTEKLLLNQGDSGVKSCAQVVCFFGVHFDDQASATFKRNTHY